MAGPLYYDRVQETSTTTGTGTYTLAGAVVGFQAFSVIGNSNTCYYTATDGTNWEVGLGTYTLAGTLLARTVVLASSNAGSAVSWAAGTKSVWLDNPAAALGSGFASTATAGGTTVLTVSSPHIQEFTGTLAQTITLPVVSTLAPGQRIYFINRSTLPLTINSSGGNLVATIPPLSSGNVTCVLITGTTAASWDATGVMGTVRELLTATRNYYVLTTGSDSNNGLSNTAGGAFLTIQKAVNVVYGTLDFGGQTVNINVGAGSYAAGAIIIGPQPGPGVLVFIGDTTTPSNVVITATSAYCFNVKGAAINVSGFKLSTVTAGDCILVSQGGVVNIMGKMDFAACAWNHMNANTDSQILANNGILTAYNITGSAGFCHQTAVGAGAKCSVQLVTVTITGTPSFGTAYAQASYNGVTEANANTFSGSATGKRFDASNNGIVLTGGATLPGSIAGTGTNSGVTPWGLQV